MMEEETLTRYQADVLKSAENNHIWLNAFSCLQPTDAFRLELADMILRMLDSSDRLILSDYDGGPLEDLGLKELIIRINKS